MNRNASSIEHEKAALSLECWAVSCKPWLVNLLSGLAEDFIDTPSSLSANTGPHLLASSLYLSLEAFCMQPPASLGPTSETAGLTFISLLQSALGQLVYHLPALGLLAHCLPAMSRQAHCLPALNPLGLEWTS